MCEILNEIKNLLDAMQAQEFTSVEEMKEKLLNIQEYVNQKINENCP